MFVERRLALSEDRSAHGRNDSGVALAGQRALESSDSCLTQPQRPADLVGLLEFFHLAAEGGDNLLLACIICPCRTFLIY